MTSISKKHLVLFFSLVLLVFHPARAQAPAKATPYRGAPVRSSLSDSSIEKRVDALLKKMTLEEKIGQLVQYSGGAPTGPAAGPRDYPTMIGLGQVGSVFNVADVKSANEFQHLAVEKSRLHIPLLFGLDVIHGYRTTLPVPLGLASTWNPEVVERGARLAAQEASADGVRWTFSPMVDISRDPRWGRIIEGAGEDPYLGSMMARAYVRGYQGKSLSDPESLAACPKHYVGYGASEAGRDYNSTEISIHTLRDVYLPPFYAALDEGAATIMSAFNSLNGVPASANPFTLTQVLREEWKFPGLVVSDWTSVGELIPHGIATDGAMAARKALNAGVDMDMESNFYHEYLLGEVKSGRVGEARIDAAVRDVLRVKFALGLFDKPYTDESRKNTGPLPADSLAVTRKAAEESFVLLKNDKLSGAPLLPLPASGKKIALIGPLADDPGQMLGSWAGRGDWKDVVTLRASLSQRLGEGNIAYAKGGEISKATDSDIEEAVAAAKSADVAVLALGENAGEMTAEAASRAHLVLPGRQEELLEKVSATGKPVVLLLFTGRPLILPWAFEHVPAIFAVWFPGVQAGPALTSVLLGDAAPSGRLTLSWPRAMGQIPLYYNALNTGRPSGKSDPSSPWTTNDPKYVSRYVDELNAPQFPFGYGLTYTDFTVGQPSLSASTLSAKSLNDAFRKDAHAQKKVLEVHVDVTNSGKVAAPEVVQLYLGQRGTSVAEPVKSLRAFTKIALKPGETRRVTFELTPESFAFWGLDDSLGVEPAKVRIWVAADSATGTPVDLTITE